MSQESLNPNTPTELAELDQQVNSEVVTDLLARLAISNHPDSDFEHHQGMHTIIVPGYN